MIWNKNPEIQSALAKKLQKFGCRARRAARGMPAGWMGKSKSKLVFFVASYSSKYNLFTKGKHYIRDDYINSYIFVENLLNLSKYFQFKAQND